MTGLVPRLREFALVMMRLGRSLPQRPDLWVIRDQLIRSGLAPGAHFREALHARSNAEFVAKLNGGLMELEETLYWIELRVHDGAIAAVDAYVEWLWDEGRQLIAILIAIVKRRRR